MSGEIESLPSGIAATVVGPRVDGVAVKTQVYSTIAQSSVAVTCPSDTSENTLASITIPGGTMGANGRIRLTTLWSTTNSANAKTLRARLGGLAGTVVFSTAVTTNQSYRDMREIGNRNSESSQVAPAGASGGFGASASAIVTSAINTAADVSLVITGQKATAAEILVLETYHVEVVYAQ